MAHTRQACCRLACCRPGSMRLFWCSSIIVTCHRAAMVLMALVYSAEYHHRREIHWLRLTSCGKIKQHLGRWPSVNAIFLLDSFRSEENTLRAADADYVRETDPSLITVALWAHC